MIPGIGDITAKKLIAYCGGVEAVFSEKKIHLEKIPGIGAATAKLITTADVFERAEEEIAFIEKHKIKTLFFTEKEYPARLKNCDDSPVLLYTKGEFDFNNSNGFAVILRYRSLLNSANFAKTILWLTMRSLYLATDLEIPKKRTITTATFSVNTGGINDAIVINHPLVTFNPTPDKNAEADNK